MDKIDCKIISLLQENARYPLKYLAEKVQLSSPAVSARIERLESQGILTGYHATLDPVTLGYHITAFINLSRLCGCETAGTLPKNTGLVLTKEEAAKLAEILGKIEV